MSLGSLAPGDVAASFAVDFVLAAPTQQVGNTFVLPRFQTGMGFEPIPEPNAIVLMGFGLAVLAATRPRR